MRRLAGICPGKKEEFSGLRTTRRLLIAVALVALLILIPLLKLLKVLTTFESKRTNWEPVEAKSPDALYPVVTTTLLVILIKKQVAVATPEAAEVPIPLEVPSKKENVDPLVKTVLLFITALEEFVRNIPTELFPLVVFTKLLFT